VRTFLLDHFSRHSAGMSVKQAQCFNIAQTVQIKSQKDTFIVNIQ